MRYLPGQQVRVNVSGLTVRGPSGQASFGGMTEAAGVIIAENRDGTYRVRLAMAVMGVNEFDVGEGRLRPG
jgi:hypothetical protein